MIKILKTTLIAGTMLLNVNTFAQTVTPESIKSAEIEKPANTHFDILLNAVSTNLNYGDSNGALTDFKKDTRGIQAGVSFQAGISSNFSLVSEFYFMMKGGKLKAANPLTNSEITQRFYGLELPVLARFHFGKFHANAGPSISYNLSGKTKINGESTSMSFANVEDGFKRFDAGAQLGGGYTLRVKQKRLALDLRYLYGLTNISRHQEIRNRSFIVSVYTSPPWRSNPLRKNKDYDRIN